VITCRAPQAINKKMIGQLATLQEVARNKDALKVGSVIVMCVRDVWRPCCLCACVHGCQHVVVCSDCQSWGHRSVLPPCRAHAIVVITARLCRWQHYWRRPRNLRPSRSSRPTSSR
jgi:hypothetical protein